MRKDCPRVMVIVLGLLAAGPVFASPFEDAPSVEPSVEEPEPTPDRPMPSIPSDDRLLRDEDGAKDGGGGPVRVPITDIPVVEYDPAKLPTPVRRLREQIIEAAATGDPENLRPIFEANGEPPALSFNESGDPVETLKALSGDPEGREILAILIEVLEAGYVHVDAGTPDEMYVWPYFARYPVNALTAPQLVELFKLVFSGDYEDMKTYGAYISYRVGIAPDGTWRFFLVGD
ncbi:MAG TPA: hypothetical protein VFK86_09765 [Bauldia sp.]|nr:hypothetical protein [Bauldia sp.]